MSTVKSVAATRSILWRSTRIAGVEPMSGAAPSGHRAGMSALAGAAAVGGVGADPRNDLPRTLDFEKQTRDEPGPVQHLQLPWRERPARGAHRFEHHRPRPLRRHRHGNRPRTRRDANRCEPRGGIHEAQVLGADQPPCHLLEDGPRLCAGAPQRGGERRQQAVEPCAAIPLAGMGSRQAEAPGRDRSR